MNINEKLLPLIQVYSKSHPTNTVEECMDFIDKISVALRTITELKEASKVSCGNCVAQNVCNIYHINKDMYGITPYKLAWICRFFKEEVDEEC